MSPRTISVPCLRLTNGGLSWADRGRDLPRLRAAFAAAEFVHLPGFLDAALLRRARTWLENAVFGFVDEIPNHHRLPTMVAQAVPNQSFNFMLNNEHACRELGEIAGLPGLTGFDGRFLRMSAAAGDFIGWHSDASECRRLALSIDVGAAPYLGGELELRGEDGRVRRMPHPRHADALLFAIRPGLEHRMAAFTAGVKEAFSGWFHDQPGKS